MRSRKYPLDPLASLRAKQVGDAARLLSDAIRARQDAEHAEGALLTQKDEAATEATGLVDRERRALERGELRAEDLARASAWSVRVEAERADLEDRLAKAMSRTRAAHGVEASAQEGVARARADAEVVARNRVKWEDAGRKKDEAVEEEAADEAFRGRPR